MRKLTIANEKKFFDEVEVGMSYSYSASYSFKEVQLLAESRGVTVAYNNPETDIYKQLGSFNFTVVSKVS